MGSSVSMETRVGEPGDPPSQSVIAHIGSLQVIEQSILARSGLKFPRISVARKKLLRGIPADAGRTTIPTNRSSG